MEQAPPKEIKAGEIELGEVALSNFKHYCFNHTEENKVITIK